MTGEFVTEGHLGGYVAGGDPDTLYPEMWRWLVEREGITSVLDVGCGDGAAMAAFREIGCDVVIGIDGAFHIEQSILVHDFTTGPLVMAGWIGCPPPYLPDLNGAPDVDAPPADWDLVWSCEFVEHVEARHIDNFMPSMTRAPLVLMTHATPGQPGWHHVNCQDGSYWRAVFDRHGYFVDETLTAETRARAHGYYAATGLAFRRREA